METAEQIRIKLAEMRLAALETEFCNANWTYSLKLKALKEQLHLKNRRQIQLNAELAALKHTYAEHQTHIKSALAQAALLDQQDAGMEKCTSRSPNTRETVSRNSPKNFPKGLFFNVGRQEKKKMYFSPNISKTPATTSWQKLHSAKDQTTKNPEKRNTLVLLKENYSIRSLGFEKTLESTSAGDLKRGSTDLTMKIQDRNGCGRAARLRQDKRGPKGY